jgi:VRR-NUC domain
MGITPNNRMLELMDKGDRPRGRAGMTAREGRERMVRTLEREEQNLFAAWLGLREADGVLCYDWSRTDRRTTNRKGMPDFRIYAQGRALLAEMKVGKGQLSADQSAMIEKFDRSGMRVELWHSAAQGIERTRDWLMGIWKNK